MQKDERFELFATYPICHWSGRLGPKLHEGDRQAPEGLYSRGPSPDPSQGRWPRSLDIGYPNAFDRAMARTGSYILVHGGCTSTGCYAMTNPVMEEIYALSEQALRQGQERIPRARVSLPHDGGEPGGACGQPGSRSGATSRRPTTVRAHARAADR